MKFKVRVCSKQKLRNRINEGLRWQKRFAILPKLCDHHLGDYRTLVWLSFYYERKALSADEYSTDNYTSSNAKLIDFNVKENQLNDPGAAWRLSAEQYTALTVIDSPLIKYHAFFSLRDNRYHYRLYKRSTETDDCIKFEDSARF